MSAHVLLNLLKKKFGKSDKILMLFRKEFNKFNSTGTHMLDSIYHMMQKNLCNSIFSVRKSRLLPNTRDILINVINITLLNLLTTSGL